MKDTKNQQNDQPLIVGVTGSAGKTTTKEMIAAILSKRGKLFKTMYNLNLPQHTAKYKEQINPDHYAAILEFALKKTGHIANHCKLIQPDIGVITNIGTAHIGNFGGSVKELAKAKGEIIGGMNPNGLLVINADDPNTKLLETTNFKGLIKKVSITNPADYQAFNIKFTEKGMSFEVNIDEANHSFHINVYGTHNIYNALSAIAVGHHLGFSVPDIKVSLTKFVRPGRRLTVSSLSNGILLIDDSFSSNPHAAMAAINALSNLGKEKTKVAVLGAMLQLGNYSTKGHHDLGQYAKEKGIDYLITYGKEAVEIGKGAISSGFPTENLIHFTDKNELEQYLIDHTQSDTVILIKGSNALNLFQTVNVFKKHFKK